MGAFEQAFTGSQAAPRGPYTLLRSVHTVSRFSSGEAVVTMHPAQVPAEYRTVLVVDDDPGVRTALVEFLSCCDIGTTEAVDGLDALEHIQTGSKPCVVVLDLEMPRVSGPEFLARLRADEGLRGIPVVTMTGSSIASARGTHGHFGKPFACETLVATLYRICRECGLCDHEPRPIGSIFTARQRARSDA